MINTATVQTPAKRGEPQRACEEVLMRRHFSWLLLPSWPYSFDFEGRYVLQPDTVKLSKKSLKGGATASRRALRPD